MKIITQGKCGMVSFIFDIINFFVILPPYFATKNFVVFIFSLESTISQALFRWRGLKTMGWFGLPLPCWAKEEPGGTTSATHRLLEIGPRPGPFWRGCMMRSIRARVVCRLYFVGNRTFILRGSGIFSLIPPHERQKLWEATDWLVSGRGMEKTYVHARILTLNICSKDSNSKLCCWNIVPSSRRCYSCAFPKQNWAFNLQTCTILYAERCNRNQGCHGG